LTHANRLLILQPIPQLHQGGVWFLPNLSGKTQADFRGQAAGKPAGFTRRPFLFARFAFRFSDPLGPPSAHLKRGRWLLQPDIPRLIRGYELFTQII